jgi:quercetin dioxygenase-like cupin family protein
VRPTAAAAHVLAGHIRQEMETAAMQPVKDTSRFYEVERRSHYAARPGFRIAEMQIGPMQTIPWHYHSKSQDTFYVISGTICVFTREPDEEVYLTVGPNLFCASGTSASCR